MNSLVKRIAGVAFSCAIAWKIAAAGGQQPAANTSQASRTVENSLTPLELQVTPTLTCIGVRWDVRGDANANAMGTLEFREAGIGRWKQALALRRTPQRANPSARFMGGLARWGKKMREYALDHYRQNYLAGSIFGLKPGTDYEVQVRLNDADGGSAARTVTVRTRVVPTVPKDGHIIEVRGGGDALKQAAAAVQPGDILRVHAGKYEGGIVVAANGTAEKPICIVAAGDGEVLVHGGPAATNNLTGIEVRGAWVRIQGLSFYNFHNCVRGQRSASNLAVMGCTMNHFYTAIRTRGDDGYFADNLIRESYHPLDATVPADDRNEGHGIECSTETAGIVVCFNAISLVADGIRLGGRDSDVYGNDVIFNIDDGIELDMGGANLRVLDNRWSFTGQNGLSFQPYIGGPAYLIRNLVIGAKESALKNRYESEGAVFINNTFLSFDGRANDLPYGSFTRNNLFLTNPGQGRRSAQVAIGKERLGELDMDYDGFGPQGPNGTPVATFSMQTGLEKHGVQFSSNEQVLAHPPGTYPQYQSRQWTVPEAFLQAKDRPHPDLALRAGSPAIGAGVTIPNVTERSDGKQPDLGALQFGEPAPHFGPRSARFP
jgi:hypothetical protein